MSWHDFGDGRAVDAATFVTAARTLLDAAVAAAGGGTETRTDFVSGLAACLSTTGPYATLRLDAGPAGQEVRAEVAANADAVSALVLDLVRDAPPAGRPGPADIHSSCVGYSWIPPVVRRLIAGPELHPARNLYNEWLWQLVLLRDALIPFTNAAEIPVLADADGLTRLREARDWFAVQVMTRRIPHEAIVRFAAEVVAGERADGAYGFQHGGAVVLPPVALDGPLLGPAYLLTRREITLVPEEVSFFVPGEDQRATTLSTPAKAAEDIDVVALSDRLVPGAPGPGRTRTLTLAVGFDGHEWTADLGQALRGHRYAARPGGTPQESTPDSATWSGCAVLREDGAVTVPDGGLIPTGGQRALALALLGKLRPGNVVLYTGQEVGGPAVLLDVRG
ncbi:hypothetical protein [Amycolatopsis sp. EV170708-02-1]|uniref:hypothetical protein n=1 Tax=Amycolatopsis sp. EV170708-02-1 TaxID=2919322 RepID=UPI001F0B7A50|nr:hypothetical protein [Amycolatopsis sp. EV170708-02-1]UMP06911.1 hypothetical protein MJQ72_19790 [Amycolatopsis sp. EV170708-02-1]